MRSQALESVTTIALAIVGVAMVAVFLSRNANTMGVIGVSGNAFTSALTAAEAPITGGGSGSFTGFSGGQSFGNPMMAY